jgi:hypothetical protein
LARDPSVQTPPVGQEGPPVRGLPAQPVPEGALNRRQFLLAMGVGLLGAACTRSGGASSQTPPGSIEAITAGATMLSVLGTGADATPMNPGNNRFGFVLINLQNQAIVGGSPQVWVAPGNRSRATGPFAATWHPFTAYEKTGDRSPASPLPGVFAADIDISTTGNWIVAVTIGQGSKRSSGTGILPITSGPVVAGLGTEAVSTPTPVATATSKIEEICTRTPVDRMHYISLDKALRNGKPSVVCFSTPLLCESRLCGPVTDEQILVFEKLGPDRANFIHVEEFLPGPDRTPPPATLEDRSPTFKAWKLETEPWVVVIDREGKIRFRSVGPVTAPEIEAALQPLL